MFEVTIEDAKRLLSTEDFEFLQNLHGDNLETVLKEAQQPPELGIASEDDFKRCMLGGVLGQYSHTRQPSRRPQRPFRGY
jgi:hypothetical protein